jgi:hypothetical protein
VERRYSSYSLSTSVLDGGEWSASRPGCALSPGKEPPVHFVKEAGGPQIRPGHRGSGKILSPPPGIEARSPSRPARSQTLYVQRYN